MSGGLQVLIYFSCLSIPIITALKTFEAITKQHSPNLEGTYEKRKS